MSTELSHLKCVIEVAICGVLDTDGGHSSTSIGGGTRNELGGLLNTTHCCSNPMGLDILKRKCNMMVGGWGSGRGVWAGVWGDVWGGEFHIDYIYMHIITPK